MNDILFTKPQGKQSKFIKRGSTHSYKSGTDSNPNMMLLEANSSRASSHRGEAKTKQNAQSYLRHRTYKQKKSKGGVETEGSEDKRSKT